MDTMTIANYTQLPNVVMLLLGLLQPGRTIALPILESDSGSEDLLPYLRQADIEVQRYREEELTKPLQKSSLTDADALLLPTQWATYFPALCEYQQKKNPLILLKCTGLGEPQTAIPEVMEIMQIEMYNKSLKNRDHFCVSFHKDLLRKFQRLSCYDMVEIPSFPKNDR